MRKLPLIVALVSISLVGVYALVVNLLPDTMDFPRIPTGPGTIGGTISRILGISDLANYTGDGTVPNTMMLSGTTSTGYLRGMNCGATQVWKTLGGGIPTCANKSTLLATLGTVSNFSGTVTTYHANGTFETIASLTGILTGDIVKTNPGSALTIVFADYSLLRIDEDSTVSLDTGTLPDGTNIAYAILENGGLWGRVLTETGGYYIGRNDLIVGVRGTAVAFTQSNPTAHISAMAPWRIIKTQSGGIGSLMILQSTSTGVAGTIRCRDTAGIEHDFDVMTGVTIPFGATLPICPSPGVRTAMNSLYTTNTGITENTLADLDYMSGVLAIPGLSPTKIARIRNEFAVTEPTTLTERDAICPDGGLSDVRIFWRSLLHTHIGSCQRADLLAVASFSGIDTYPARARFFMNSGITLTPFNNSVYGTDLQGIKLTSIGDSLQYEKNEFGDLQGKTFYIVLNDNPPATPRYIFDAGNCAVRTTDSGDHWTIGAGACTINKISDRAVKITLTSNPSSSVLYFGNYSTLTKPIGTKIKAITLIQ